MRRIVVIPEISKRSKISGVVPGRERGIYVSADDALDNLITNLRGV
jgi:hypothetical protein